MILVDSLLYKIDQKLNKLSTNEHQAIQLEDKILALNEAQLILIKQKVNGTSTPSGLGLDSFRKRYEDLQNLVEDYIDHPLDLKENDKNINQYSSSLSLTPKYMFYVDAYVLATKGRCKDRKIWVNKDLARHGDIQFLLNNDHYKPSFEYQETFNILSTDEISIFTDGSFQPSKLYLSYIRYPKYIDKAGYVKFDGAASADENCELVDYLEDELLDIAVQNLAEYTENSSAVQSAQLRMSKSE
jgi:hypothetical protein